jgi:Domain of unknown function (DUF2760)
MTESNMSFLGRLSLAVGTFFAVLGDREFAAQVRRLRDGSVVAAPVTAPQPAAAAAPAIKETSPEAALQLLGLLQRGARFVDFVEEDIAGYSDADIGAAARLVHDGCRATLREHFTIRPVREEAEGNVVGKPPFNGTISHRGWRVEEVRLPMLTKTHDATVIAQAEVEL